MKKEDLLKAITTYSPESSPDFYKKYTNESGWILEELVLLPNILLHDLYRLLRTN